ncbi:MAG: signal peptidase I [Planctomycetales bacterium]|nr:signal peptidase I [Planctomycetales bacterium]
MGSKRKKQKAARDTSGQPTRQSTGASTVAAAPVEVAPHRDAIESIIIAIVLALLFRTFEAEAFVIPTGSMAPTLLGRNKEMRCDACNYLFAIGANEDSELRLGQPVVSITCPLCRHVTPIDPKNSAQDSFGGDRILVNKFAYQFGEPQRWDVIVFKNPSNAKQNYIKRLIGLPNETVRIQSGDIFTKSGDEPFRIARKPPEKIRRLLRLVHDTDHIPVEMLEDDWPLPWQNAATNSGPWQISKDRQQYDLDSSAETAWLFYAHVPPDDWHTGNEMRTSTPRPQLITDILGYNTAAYAGQPGRAYVDGNHWVGDLALNASVQVKSSSGTIHMRLIEGGRAFDCTIDVANGQATLKVPDDTPFEGNGGTELTASTRVRKPGRYDLTLSNIDDQLLLWINRDLVVFQTAAGQNHDGAYQGIAQVSPAWTPDEPGDLHPARIGGTNIEMQVARLRVARDIYYIAVDGQANSRDEYDMQFLMSQANVASLPNSYRVFQEPDSWATTSLFASRRTVEKELGEDQFFPLGDNSAMSKDARLWHGREPSVFDEKGYIVVPHWVERERLIGKAFVVYWPHGWKVGNVPIVPNVRRMGRIR